MSQYGGIEPEPDQEDLRQYPDGYQQHSVPVHTDRPVMTWPLPAKRAVMFTYDIGLVQTVEVIPADPRIKSVIISSSTAGSVIYLGTSEQLSDLTRPRGFLLLPGVVYPPFEGFDEEIFAIGIGTGGKLSLRIQRWAD